MNINELIKTIENEQPKSQYEKAKKYYALEICDNIKNHYNFRNLDKNLENVENLQEYAMNGADSWSQYSWGGCSLVYNEDILQNIFCKSIAKKYQNADTVRGIHLLDYQANALVKAFSHIKRILKQIKSN